jgi:hypothetical protein
MSYYASYSYASALRNVPFALLLLALTAATAVAQHKFTDCGSTKLVPSAVFFFPDPPVRFGACS